MKRWAVVPLVLLFLAGAAAGSAMADDPQSLTLDGWTDESYRHPFSPVEDSEWPGGVVREQIWSSAPERGRQGWGVKVPEPLLFDLVRPLGPTRGDIEFNTLAIFPWRAKNRQLGDDPFGPGPSTPDRQQVEWAPEVEIALSDRLAIEFELPFEGGTLEELKLGIQWTFGTAFDDHYIHGVQVLIEPTPQFETWNSTLLYLGGVRLDETWSVLFMFGGRMDLEGSDNFESFERLVNGTLFAEVNDWLTLGLESNLAVALDGTSNFILVPQSHIELTDRWELQAGLGLGTATEGYELSGIVRLIYAR